MRIGIVTSVAATAEVLRRAVTLRPEHRVLWSAGNGRTAAEHCANDPADLVLLDLSVNGAEGIDTTKRIMHGTPCAILLVTASVRGNVNQVFEAMGGGALDAVDAPVAGDVDLRSAAPLLAKIDTISRLLGGVHRTRRAARHDRHPAPRGRNRIIVIGASAGGPAALAAVLRPLPRDFSAAIVIVQHVDEHFARGMADWLSQDSALPVRLAAEGECPQPGCALLAGTRQHLQLKAVDRLGYTEEPRDALHHPSIDVFFHSVGRLWEGEVVGVLLTGMGRDGALGLKALRVKGHHTIAQDEATSAVYGMPKAAVNLDAVDEILPVDRIAPRLIELCRV